MVLASLFEVFRRTDAERARTQAEKVDDARGLQRGLLALAQSPSPRFGHQCIHIIRLAAADTLRIPPPADLPAKPRKRWITVGTDTPNGRFSSTDTLDWICTFAGREVRGGQAGFPRGMGQPQGWIEITGTDTFAAIGWNTILLYSPKQQRVVHIYRLLSRAVHAVYDSSTRTILVAHGDGVIRRWPIPASLTR